MKALIILIALLFCVNVFAAQPKNTINCNVNINFGDNVTAEKIRFLIKHLPVFYNKIHKEHIYFKSSDGDVISWHSIIYNKERIINDIYHTYTVTKYDDNILELYSPNSYIKIFSFLNIPFKTIFTIQIDELHRIVHSTLNVEFYSDKDYNMAISKKYNHAICKHLEEELYGGFYLADRL